MVFCDYIYTIIKTIININTLTMATDLNKQQKLAAKIKALLAKTVENGASEEEAKMALAKANQLMIDNYMDINSIDELTKIDEIIVHSRKHRVKQYSVNTFYDDLAKLFDVQAFSRGRGKTKELILIGYSHDIEITNYFIDVVFESLNRAIDKYRHSADFVMDQMEWNDSTKRVLSNFAIGYIDRIKSTIRLELANKLAKLRTNDNVNALVVSKDSKIDDYVNTNFMVTMVSNNAPQVNRSTAAYATGQHKGKDFSFDKPINDETVDTKQLTTKTDA